MTHQNETVWILIIIAAMTCIGLASINPNAKHPPSYDEEPTPAPTSTPVKIEIKCTRDEKGFKTCVTIESYAR